MIAAGSSGPGLAQLLPLCRCPLRRLAAKPRWPAPGCPPSIDWPARGDCPALPPGCAVPLPPVDIVKILSTAIHSGTAGEVSVAGTAEIMTVVGWYGPSKMHFLKATPPIVLVLL
ncbi:hypothetical protein Tco_0840884 [Tanacetum coccineum]|uniref:Uncharacterized protein n=1 Tax=Tanacetum coccineum TaxID=301880 RepID=A0ABQ5AX76_9ASTR